MIRFKDKKYVDNCWTFVAYHHASQTVLSLKHSIPITMSSTRSCVRPTIRYCDYVSVMMIPKLDHSTLDLILCINRKICVYFPPEYGI